MNQATMIYNEDFISSIVGQNYNETGPEKYFNDRC